jgi:hypothetical protein
MLASHLEQSDRVEDAITQYVRAYRIMQRQGPGDLAESVAAKVRRMDPDFDLEKAVADPLFGRGATKTLRWTFATEFSRSTSTLRMSPSIFGPSAASPATRDRFPCRIR